jgi:hypothetical protein
MALKGVVFNRVHEELAVDGEAPDESRSADDDVEVVRSALAACAIRGPHVEWLARNFVDYQALARGEALRMEQFRAGIRRGIPFITVPNFESDLHDLVGLSRMHDYLFAREAGAGTKSEASTRGAGRARSGRRPPAAPARRPRRRP